MHKISFMEMFAHEYSFVGLFHSVALFSQLNPWIISILDNLRLQTPPKYSHRCVSMESYNFVGNSLIWLTLLWPFWPIYAEKIYIWWLYLVIMRDTFIQMKFPCLNLSFVFIFSFFSLHKQMRFHSNKTNQTIPEEQWYIPRFIPKWHIHMSARFCCRRATKPIK